MAYITLTEDQVREINKALSVIVDPTIRQSLTNALDVIAGADTTAIDAVEASITNLNAWATALATKLNADAGVTDANYDTNPQA